MAKRLAKGSAVKRAGRAMLRMLAWSYSRWTDYEKCPAFARYKHIDHIKEPDNEAMEHGTIVHQLAAHYATRTLKKFPKELGVFQQEFETLRAGGAVAEQEWAFDVAYNPVSWFSKQAWLRIKVDTFYLSQAPGKRKGTVETVVTIVDYKTGKNRPEHAQQRSLYALGGLLMYPDAVAVVAEHWYVDSGEIESETYPARDLPKLKQKWEQRTRALLADTTFAPRPGAYCRWCFFSNHKGGPCRF